jgi:predicted metal-binding protein
VPCLSAPWIRHTVSKQISASRSGTRSAVDRRPPNRIDMHAASMRKISKRLVAPLLLWLLFNVAPYSYALSVIKVCQNKDCCRNFQGKSSLVQVLQDLTDEGTTTASSSNAITVQSTGCLSKCDQGPNVCIDDEISNGIQTPLHAAALIPNASNKLINAVLLLEKAQAGTYASVEASSFVACVVVARSLPRGFTN